ncbi:hypothetical protein RhiLY_12388 [Ceratobasidium sp. AG-Ba]|nr:hypothetical protein RhiLY_12388 [Ceratobasidium sp. AG-Ba]
MLSSDATDDAPLNNIGRIPDWNETGFEDENITNDDLLTKVPDIYRLLDLYQESGSGGRVEKILIDQNSLSHLINRLSPGSYESVSEIKFKHLDKLSIEPIGIYGSELEIVKFLRGVNCLSEESESLLISSIGLPTALRSGLYIALQQCNEPPDEDIKRAFIVYWPEPTSWNDVATSSVDRNRVTFMHYLSKLTDQTIAVISAEQARAMVWSQETSDPEEPDEFEDEDVGQYEYTVRRVQESDEDAIVVPGFTVKITPRDVPVIDRATEFNLVQGEEKAGLLVSWTEPGHEKRQRIDETWNEAYLRSICGSIALGNIPFEEVITLGEVGLRELFPQPFLEYDAKIVGEDQIRAQALLQDTKGIEIQVAGDEERLRGFIARAIQGIHHKNFPALNFISLESTRTDSDALLLEQYPNLAHIVKDMTEDYDFGVINNFEFKRLKKEWLDSRNSTQPTKTSSEPRFTSVGSGLAEENGEKSEKSDGIMSKIWQKVSSKTTDLLRLTHIRDRSDLTDSEFVASLHSLSETYSDLNELTDRIDFLAESYQRGVEATLSEEYLKKIQKQAQDDRLVAQTMIHDSRFNSNREKALITLCDQLKSVTNQHLSRTTIVQIDHIQKTRKGKGRQQYHIRGQSIRRYGPQTRFLIYPLELTQDDIQQCVSDKLYIPTPEIASNQYFEFTLPEGHTIEYVQLVRNKCLVVIAEPQDYCVYMENNIHLKDAIRRRLMKRHFNRDKLDQKCVFAFDEATRHFAMLYGQKHQHLITYGFDEMLSSLEPRTMPFSLTEWYDADEVVEDILFVSGSDELYVFGSLGGVRIFSLSKKDFRSASVHLAARGRDAFSTPDGSCLLVSVLDESLSSSQELLAFHSASFGDNQDGIRPEQSLPNSDTRRIVTSLQGRDRIYVLSYCSKSRIINSCAVRVKQRVTNYVYGTDLSRRPTNFGNQRHTVNNCFLDCHREAWTRYPIVSAIPRSTSLSTLQRPRSLIFSSPVDLSLASVYFSRMLESFKKATRKPISTALAETRVLSSLDHPVALVQQINRSRYPLGRFFVELLCLIPLHLAVARDNRFIPFKDGVQSPEHERSLLGEAVSAINLDTDEEIKSTGSDAVFHVPELSPGMAPAADDAKPFMRDLICRYSSTIGSRHSMGEDLYIDQLQQHLSQDLDRRLSCVKEWLVENLKAFDDEENHDIRKLCEEYDELARAMRDMVKLCSKQCKLCFLRCTSPDEHSGDHDCATSHKCEELCEIEAEHSVPEKCGLGAGHDSQHLCRVTKASICALLEFISVQSHANCFTQRPAIAALTFATLSTAMLTLVILASKQPGALSSVSYARDIVPPKITSMALMSRRFTCAIRSTNAAESVMLPIETEPTKEKATFSGRFDDFEYTKFTQVQQREKCGVPIPPGKLDHGGAHVHTVKPGIIHFCTKKCADCGYYCILPYGQ